MLKGDLLESQSWLRCSPTCAGQGATPNSNLAGAVLILYLNLLTHIFTRSSYVDCTVRNLSCHTLVLRAVCCRLGFVVQWPVFRFSNESNKHNALLNWFPNSTTIKHEYSTEQTLNLIPHFSGALHFGRDSACCTCKLQLLCDIVCALFWRTTVRRA